MGNIRIIGGEWRSRQLHVLDSPYLRPTTDIMRETLFNWLSPVIPAARCLDCFAGTGALGLEALSRKAASVILLEKNSNISAQLNKNIQLLHAKNAHLVNVDSLNWLNKPGDRFNIVFLDPPFHINQGLLSKVIALLEYNGRFAKQSWIYIEMAIDSNMPNVAANWQLYREKITKKIIYRLYFRK